MRYNLFLLQYNNYYNRQLKTTTLLSDYSPYLVASILDCNIDIKDAINTNIIINYKSDLATPNYLLIQDRASLAFTRWFVIECSMTRGLQYSLTIRRDVIADYFETIKKSPCLIQKGYVDDNNILVFNNEQQNYNKVKQQELLLKDNTGMGYVVGFLESNTDYANKIETTYKGSMQVDFDYDSLSQEWKNLFAIGSSQPVSSLKRIYDNSRENICLRFPLGMSCEDIGSSDRWTYSGYQYITGDGYNSKPQWVSGSGTALGTYGYYYTSFVTGMSTVPASDVSVYYQTTRSSIDSGSKYFQQKYSNQMAVNVAASNIPMSLYNDLFNIDDYLFTAFNYYNNKICEINGVYYQANITRLSSTTENVSDTSNLSVWKAMLPTHSQIQNYDVTAASYIPSMTISNLNSVQVYAKTEQLYLQLTQIENTAYTYLSPSNTRNHLIDAPYDMFVIPYSNNITYTVNGSDYVANEDLAINLAQQIAINSGSASYDIQIVPYCPFTNIQDNDFSIYSNEAIKDGNDTTIGYYFWCERSSGQIKLGESREELTLVNSDFTYKEISQLNEYILCSPDKSSQWMFNPAMNRGITQWNVSFDYRPFSSYVKVQPHWNYLYGEDYYNNETDYRGLIYNGSYSLTQLNDAWANYVNNNKNYQAIFDTQIGTQVKKFDMNQKAQWDTVGMRNYSFNPISAVLGIVGENKQMEFDRKVFDLDLANQRALFDYQLDNIQSMPRTISKLTSINTDFRVWPFVEIYSTTIDDRNHFNDMIKYNGMTIMVTGYIEDYLKPSDETFIKATLIRFYEFSKQENDFTLVEAINYELSKGIYITKEE